MGWKLTTRRRGVIFLELRFAKRQCREQVEQRAFLGRRQKIVPEHEAVRQLGGKFDERRLRGVDTHNFGLKAGPSLALRMTAAATRDRTDAVGSCAARRRAGIPSGPPGCVDCAE